MSRTSDAVLAAVGLGIAAGAALQVVGRTDLSDRLSLGSRRTYAATCCGAVFAPGTGPDDIRRLTSEGVAADTLLTVSDATRMAAPEAARHFPAYRDGACPACGAPRPALERL